MKIKAIVLVMAFVALYFIGVTEVLSVEESEIENEKPPIVILDAEVSEITNEKMFFNANVFGEIHPFHIPADSAPELNVGDSCLLALEMICQDFPETWEIRGIK